MSKSTNAHYLKRSVARYLAGYAYLTEPRGSKHPARLITPPSPRTKRDIKLASRAQEELARREALYR